MAQASAELVASELTILLKDKDTDPTAMAAREVGKQRAVQAMTTWPRSNSVPFTANAEL